MTLENLKSFEEVSWVLMGASTSVQKRELILSIDEALAKHLDKIGKAAFCEAARRRGKIVETRLSGEAVSKLWPEIEGGGGEITATVLSYLKPERSPLQRLTLSEEKAPQLYDVWLKIGENWIAKHEVDEESMQRLKSV